MSADIYEKLQIAISHAKVAPDSFAFLCKQIEAWRATDKAALSQPAADDAANLVTVDKRDLFDFVRSAIKDALSTEDELMHNESWLWAESDFRACKCLNKLAIKEQK